MPSDSDDLLGQAHQALKDARVLERHLVHAVEVGLGDHEHVHRRLGRDVVERERLLGFGGHLRGDLARDNLAEEAVTHLVPSSLLISHRPG